MPDLARPVGAANHMDSPISSGNKHVTIGNTDIATGFAIMNAIRALLRVEHDLVVPLRPIERIHGRRRISAPESLILCALFF